MFSRAAINFDKLFKPHEVPRDPTGGVLSVSENPATKRLAVHEYQDDQMIEKALLEDSFIEHGLLAVDKSVSIFGEIVEITYVLHIYVLLFITSTVVCSTK